MHTIKGALDKYNIYLSIFNSIAQFTATTEQCFKEYLCKADNDEAETSESLWSEFKTILSKTADQVLGKCKCQPKKPWISTTVLMLAEEKSNLRKKGRSPDQEQHFKELRSEPGV